MRLAGLALLVAGWLLVLAALILLPPTLAPRMAFALAGICVEVLGFVLFARTHLPGGAPRNDA